MSNDFSFLKPEDEEFFAQFPPILWSMTPEKLNQFKEKVESLLSKDNFTEKIFNFNSAGMTAKEIGDTAIQRSIAIISAYANLAYKYRAVCSLYDQELFNANETIDQFAQALGYQSEKKQHLTVVK
jgi:hypothetical protein